MTLRIEAGARFRSGSRLPTFATVEWSGRIGHPSSYALLGGARSPETRVSVFASGAAFNDALAAPADDVRWGLPPEYEKAVLNALADRPEHLVVSRAAYAEIGSSEVAFKGVALMLCQILTVGLPSDDGDVWKMLDRCWNSS